MSQIFWIHVESQYRGQASSGLILTLDEEAMNKALKNAGNAVFDTEWWVETLPQVLEHWGLRSKRWLDHTTGMPHMHYTLGAEKANTGPLTQAGPAAPGTPAPKTTGPLTARLNSGRLNSGYLNSGKLNSGGLNSSKLNNEDK